MVERVPASFSPARIRAAFLRRSALVRCCFLLVVAALVGFGTVAGIIATVLAVVMLGTAAVGSCPLYFPFHINTGKHNQPAA